MAKRTPHRTASLTGYLKRAPNRSKIDFICYFEGNCGCLETGGLTTTHRLMVNRSRCRCIDRMGARCASKCPSFEPPFGRFEPPFRTIFQDLNRFYRGSLLHPASQLQWGAGGTLGLSQGANSHVYRPFVHKSQILYTLLDAQNHTRARRGKRPSTDPRPPAPRKLTCGHTHRVY